MMKKQKIGLCILLCFALLLQITACGSKKEAPKERTPLKDVEDLLDRLVSADGQSFQLELPWFSSEETTLQFFGLTADDVKYRTQTDTTALFETKEKLSFENMGATYQMNYQLLWDQLQWGKYVVYRMTEEENTSFCTAFEKWASELVYSPSSVYDPVPTLEEFLEAASQYDESDEAVEGADIGWTDKNGYEFHVSWGFSTTEPYYGACVLIEVTIPIEVFYEEIGETYEKKPVFVQ